MNAPIFKESFLIVLQNNLKLHKYFIENSNFMDIHGQNDVSTQAYVAYDDKSQNYITIAKNVNKLTISSGTKLKMIMLPKPFSNLVIKKYYHVYQNQRHFIIAEFDSSKSSLSQLKNTTYVFTFIYDHEIDSNCIFTKYIWKINHKIPLTQFLIKLANTTFIQDKQYVVYISVGSTSFVLLGAVLLMIMKFWKKILNSFKLKISVNLKLPKQSHDNKINMYIIQTTEQITFMSNEILEIQLKALHNHPQVIQPNLQIKKGIVYTFV